MIESAGLLDLFFIFRSLFLALLGLYTITATITALCLKPLCPHGYAIYNMHTTIFYILSLNYNRYLFKKAADVQAGLRMSFHPDVVTLPKGKLEAR